MTNISASSAANNGVETLDWRELLRQSKETHDRNFGKNSTAEWIFADLEELFGSVTTAA